MYRLKKVTRRAILKRDTREYGVIQCLAEHATLSLLYLYDERGAIISELGRRVDGCGVSEGCSERCMLS